MRDNRKQFLWSLILLGITFLFQTGCSDKQQLHGHVRFEDGSPLTIGTVCFVSDHYFSRGILSNDGSYRVGSESKKDGIPPGVYKVYIMGAIEEIKDGNDSKVYLLIDPKFTKPETTPLEITIPGTKTFDFFVEPPMKK